MLCAEELQAEFSEDDVDSKSSISVDPLNWSRRRSRSRSASAVKIGGQFSDAASKNNLERAASEPDASAAAIKVPPKYLASSEENSGETSDAAVT